MHVFPLVDLGGGGNDIVAMLAIFFVCFVLFCRESKPYGINLNLRFLCYVF